MKKIRKNYTFVKRYDVLRNYKGEYCKYKMALHSVLTPLGHKKCH